MKCKKGGRRIFTGEEAILFIDERPFIEFSMPEEKLSVLAKNTRDSTSSAYNSEACMGMGQPRAK